MTREEFEKWNEALERETGFLSGGWERTSAYRAGLALGPALVPHLIRGLESDAGSWPWIGLLVEILGGPNLDEIRGRWPLVRDRYVEWYWGEFRDG